MQDKATPFPTLNFDPPEQAEWPPPPLAWRHQPPPLDGVAQPCSVEAVTGVTVQGEMLAFEPVARRLAFRSKPDGPTGLLAFARFRRLTLTTPLRAAPPVPGALAERLPAAAQERAYTLHPVESGAPPLTGRTAGHVETDAGIYLFTPVEEEAALQRVFVPRSAYSRCDFGQSAEEVAAQMWISSPQELVEAIARQERMPVLPIGQSLLALGFVTERQLARGLAKQADGRPLGETLVAAGLLTHKDLQTALAHKMGYPVVNLNRFPVDPKAVAKLPHDTAERYHVLPLMLDKSRLIVAVDSPARVTKLRSLQIHAQATIVPVLAPWIQIVQALRSSDVWSQESPDRNRFFLTTR